MEARCPTLSSTAVPSGGLIIIHRPLWMLIAGTSDRDLVVRDRRLWDNKAEMRGGDDLASASAAEAKRLGVLTPACTHITTEILHCMKSAHVCDSD